MIMKASSALVALVEDNGFRAGHAQGLRGGGRSEACEPNLFRGRWDFNEEFSGVSLRLECSSKASSLDLTHGASEQHWVKWGIITSTPPTIHLDSPFSNPIVIVGMNMPCRYVLPH
jgi:hypothetical protein